MGSVFSVQVLVTFPYLFEGNTGELTDPLRIKIQRRKGIDLRDGRVDSHNRRRDAEGINHTQPHLLRSGHLELADGVHRKQQDDEVGGDGDDGVGGPAGLEVDAGALAVSAVVVGAADGDALEPLGGAEGEHEEREEDDEGSAGELERPLVAEDAQVEEEDGDFGQVEGEAVKDLGSEEEL